MAIQIRCTQCGKILSVEADGQSEVSCPHCHAKVEVPSAVATMPQPHVPADTAPPPVAATAGAPSPTDLSPAPSSAPRWLGLATQAGPFLVSACLHASVVVLLYFAVSVSVQLAPVVGEITSPDSDEFSDAAPTGRLDLANGPGIDTPTPIPGPLAPGEGKGWAPTAGGAGEGDNWGAAGEGTGEMTAYGINGGGGGGGKGTGDFGMGGAGGTVKAKFYGTGGGGGNAWYVCFVIDHSGSVMEEFDGIRSELKKSIFQLTDKQQFHVLFFSKDTFDEFTPKRLVPATEENKRDAVKYLSNVTANGYGSSPIPALIRAFQSLQNVDTAGGKKGKVLYVLTDGDFDMSGYQYKTPDGSVLTGNEAVVAWLRDNNKDKSVHIFPMILGPKPSPKTEEIMTGIAKDNGGKYTWIEKGN